MSVEIAAEPNAVEEPSVSTPFPKMWWGRLSYGLFVTILPAFSFWAIGFLKPEWQNGELRSYIILLLLPDASWLFFPLLAYSIICYLLILLMPARFSKMFLVRCGIYTGVLLALQYSILVMYSIGPLIYVLILVWIFPFVYSMIYRWSITRWTARRVNNALFMLILGALLIATLIDSGNALFFVLVALTAAAPFWSLLLALQTANWLLKNYESQFSLPRGLGLIIWLSAYAAAWRFDIVKMYEVYARLPATPPPDCYIATAAARGHPQVVGAWTVHCREGSSMQVNRQLQRLKCAELALRAIHPQFHGVLRRVYDRSGKVLAHHIQNPFLADFAYVLLKPWEWMAAFILELIVPEIDSISQKMYTN